MNFMSTVIMRSKNLMVRVGGNSQEQSVLVEGGLEDGAMIEKGAIGSSRVRDNADLLAVLSKSASYPKDGYTSITHLSVFGLRYGQYFKFPPYNPMVHRCTFQ